MGIEHDIVKELCRQIQLLNDKQSIDLQDVVNKILWRKNRYWVNIGIVALNNEAKALNGIKGSGIVMTRKAAVKIQTESRRPNIKKANQIMERVKKDKALDPRKVFFEGDKFADDYIRKRVMEEPEVKAAFEAWHNMYLNPSADEKERDKLYLEYARLADEATTRWRAKKEEIMISYGACRGRIDPFFDCYEVRYPCFQLENIQAKILFLEELARCKLVVNSIFCFAGSAKIYNAAVKNLRDGVAELYASLIP